MLENEVDRGFIEEFLSQLPEKAFHLGLRVVLAGLAFLVGVQLIRILRHVIKKALGRSRIEESAMRFIDSFIKFGLYFVLILMIASSLGVDAASILAILGSASVAIGLAVQGSLSNFAGGVLLLILKPFMAGDYIKDGLGNEGTVDAVDIFYTQLVTPDNRVVVLPNGTLANGTITNFTRCREGYRGGFTRRRRGNRRQGYYGICGLAGGEQRQSECEVLGRAGGFLAGKMEAYGSGEIRAGRSGNKESLPPGGCSSG